jgi:trk system potassium uptake protein
MRLDYCMRQHKTLLSPTQYSVLAFALFILLGTALLMLPVASTQGSLSFVDALFTSTSAGCVTGLSVMDIGKTLSLFGQMVLLILVQVGGLGIITLSTVFLSFAGRRPSMAGRMVVEDTFTHSGDKRLGSLLLDVFRFTFVIEGVGAIFLFFRFLPGRSFLEAAYLGIFHSICSFCNAGFSVFSDNLMGFRGDWLVNLVVCSLIVLGGIGFLVLAEIKRNFPFHIKTWSRLSLHSHIALSTTFVLIVSGMALIYFLERHNTLASLSSGEKFLATLFQSVTSRTAGFNTLPIGQMADASLLVLILLMFIGACSGSTGGGIKAGTFATLLMWGVSRVRGHEHPQGFNRSIAQASLGRAISVAMVSLFLVTLSSLVILMTQVGGLPHGQSKGKFLELVFEVVSAFGTVGLSTGITTELNTVSKVVLSFVMFCGRLGPLVVALAVTRKKVLHYHYAEENIMIG